MTETQITPRIAPVQDPDEDQRTELESGPQLDGRPMNVFATLAHAPRILSACNGLGAALQVDSPLSFRQRELVILRTAAHAGSEYEMFHHTKLGASAGMSDDELAAAVDVTSRHPWAPEEAALLRVTDELATTCDVSNEAWAGLGDDLDDAARISLLTLVGFFRLVGGVLNGARVQLESD
jgi:4-carboxymuconolactone decarboxylase